jgi:peptidoglycan hydrolase-like protein with peptidoglycan-binding domain
MVRSVQEDLRALNYLPSVSPVDGIFGPVTRDAVVRFQRANGLAVDGVVGTQTISKLASQAGNTSSSTSGGRLLRLGSRGDAVRGLQEDLIALKYSVGSSGADGVFGPATRDAVVRFQRANNLAADGIVGPRTMKVLIGE